MAKQSKKAKALATAIDRDKLHGIDEAISLIKGNATAKFDETVEIAMNLGVDPRHADQMVRGVVTLPAGTGKDVRVAVFARNDKAAEATAAGADVVGAEDLLESIQNGNIDFQRVIATPDMMGLVGRLGKVLGPKGLMPSPKAGTVTTNVPEAVKEYSAGKVEYRADKGGNVHAVIGKMSFPEGDLVANLEHFIHAIEKVRPATAKGLYIKKITISGAMTPGVQIKYVQAVAAE